MLKRMHFVQRKATTSKNKQSVEEFDLIRRAYLEDFVATVENGRDTSSINIQLGPNWDKTCAINIMDNGRKRIKEGGAYWFKR